MASKHTNHLAGVDLSTHQFRFVKFDGSGNLVKAGAGDQPDFIVSDKPANGKVVGVFDRGSQGKLQVAAAVTKGTRLKSDAAGKGVAVAGAGEWYGAIAEEVSTADGDVINVHVVAKTQAHA